MTTRRTKPRTQKRLTPSAAYAKLPCLYWHIHHEAPCPIETLRMPIHCRRQYIRTEKPAREREKRLYLLRPVTSAQLRALPTPVRRLARALSLTLCASSRNYSSCFPSNSRAPINDMWHFDSIANQRRYYTLIAKLDGLLAEHCRCIARLHDRVCPGRHPKYHPDNHHYCWYIKEHTNIFPDTCTTTHPIYQSLYTRSAS
jgi:hypothetical protein